jgi:hypothetical protein
MNLKPTIILAGLGLLFGLLTVLFCGISRDWEFYEPSIFVKHRPTLKLHFYSPIGERDFMELNEKDRKEVLAYREFVEDQKVYTDNLNRLWFLPPILIQLSLTFFAFGTARQDGIDSRRLLLHFVINLLPTAVLVELMLFNEKYWQVIGLTTIVVIANIWTIRFTRRKSSAQHT